METKKLGALALGFAGLTALAAFLQWNSGKGPASTQPLGGLTAAKVVKLQVERRGEILTVEKSGGEWRLTAPGSDLADSNPVNDLVNGLLQLSLGSSVASDPASYPTYDLNDSSATRVRLYAEGSAAPDFDGYFGKRAIGYDSMYFRKAGERPVLIASGLPAYQFDRAPDDFRERALTRIDRDSLSAAKVTAGGKTLEIRKSSAAWTAPGSTLAAEKLEPIVTALLNLRIARFPAAGLDPKTCGFEKPYLSAELTGATGASSFKLGKPTDPKAKKPDRRWVQVRGREAVGEVSATDAEALRDLLGATH